MRFSGANYNINIITDYSIITLMPRLRSCLLIFQSAPVSSFILSVLSEGRLAAKDYAIRHCLSSLSPTCTTPSFFALLYYCLHYSPGYPSHVGPPGPTLPNLNKRILQCPIPPHVSGPSSAFLFDFSFVFIFRTPPISRLPRRSTSAVTVPASRLENSTHRINTSCSVLSVAISLPTLALSTVSRLTPAVTPSASNSTIPSATGPPR